MKVPVRLALCNATFVLLHACATTPADKISRTEDAQRCVRFEPHPEAWHLMETDPPNASELRTLGFNGTLWDPSRTLSSFYWFSSNTDQLMLCDAGVYGGCSFTTWKFKSVDGKWVTPGPQQAICELRRSAK